MKLFIAWLGQLAALASVFSARAFLAADRLRFSAFSFAEAAISCWIISVNIFTYILLTEYTALLNQQLFTNFISEQHFQRFPVEALQFSIFNDQDCLLIQFSSKYIIDIN